MRSSSALERADENHQRRHLRHDRRFCLPGRRLRAHFQLPCAARRDRPGMPPEPAADHPAGASARMATSSVLPGGSPGNLTGIVELEIDQLDVRPDYGLNAIAIEIVSPTGDGVRLWLDLGAALDLVLRIVASCMRLRRLTP
jgi:hypothetical protein